MAREKLPIHRGRRVSPGPFVFGGPVHPFFEEGVQLFLGMLHEPAFRSLFETLAGYDLSLCGKMVFPQESAEK